MASDMADRFRSDHHPQVRDDILALPTLELRKLALTRITQLVRGEIFGTRLENRAGWALGEGAFKLYFPERHMLASTSRERRSIAARDQGGWRIVYRLLEPVPGGDHRRRLQVLAVGPRVDSQVYNAANDRLLPARSPEPAALPTPRVRQALPQRSLYEAQQAAVRRPAQPAARWRR